MRESPLYDDIGAGHVREDERFHYQRFVPYCQAFGFNDWLYRRVEWYGLSLPDGSAGHFASYIVLWFFRWYKGTAKCDGSRTYYCRERLYDPEVFVITTTPKEMFRICLLCWGKSYREIWSNMGGIGR